MEYFHDIYLNNSIIVCLNGEFLLRTMVYRIPAAVKCVK